MSKTFIARFIGVGDEDIQETVRYLDQVGMSMTYRGTFEHVLFHIELQEMPEIMFALEQRAYFTGGSKIWEMLRLSSEGLALYITHATADAFIFIPKEKIICIHTASEDFLKGIGGK